MFLILLKDIKLKSSNLKKIIQAFIEFVHKRPIERVREHKRTELADV